MGYERTTAHVYGQSIALAMAVEKHIVAEDRYNLEPAAHHFAAVRSSAEDVVEALLAVLRPLDNGGDRILQESAQRAAAALRRDPAPPAV